MNNTINTICGNGYQHIQVITDDTCSIDALADLMKLDHQSFQAINRTEFLQQQLLSEAPADLLIIDIDALGIADASYLCFMVHALKPETPIVLVTAESMPATVQQRLMSNGILDVVQLASAATVAAA